MLVEDPCETLMTMCKFKNSTITWNSFKTKYEEITGRTNDPVDEKTVDTHFYTLTIFDLLIPQSTKGQYKLSLTGKDLCDLLCNPKKDDEFKKLLASILLGNEHKGDLFKKFLKFVEKPREKKEIYKEFKNFPGRTLIAWCYLASLIEIQIDTVWKVNRGITKFSMDEFNNMLSKTYNEMQKTGMFGVRRIFMNLDELRKNVCYRLGGISIDKFNECLTKLLNTPSGKKIRLYGAPTSVFEERRNFNYRGRLYAYISIGE